MIKLTPILLFLVVSCAELRPNKTEIIADVLYLKIYKDSQQHRISGVEEYEREVE